MSCSICKKCGHNRRTCPSKGSPRYPLINYYLNGKEIAIIKEYSMDKKTKKNKGEIGEINTINYLYDNRDDKDIINKIFGIRSRIVLIDPSNNEIITDKNSINKSPGYVKADIIIDFIEVPIKHRVSIKCNDGSKPTLLNHTSLNAKCWDSKLKDHIEPLTSIVQGIIDKRKSGVYKEDIPCKNLELTDIQKKCLIEVSSYFTFDGTGSCDSKCCADSILIVGNSNDVSNTSEFKDCGDKESKEKYIESILPKLRISLRSKGMPTKEEQIEKCRPWIYEYTDKKGNIRLCGALHIRFI